MLSEHADPIHGEAQIRSESWDPAKPYRCAKLASAMTASMSRLAIEFDAFHSARTGHRKKGNWQISYEDRSGDCFHEEKST